MGTQHWSKNHQLRITEPKIKDKIMKFDSEKVIEESSNDETSGTDGDNENESDVESEAENDTEDLPQKFDLTKLNERLEDGPPSCSESEEEEDSDLEEDEFENDSEAENNDDDKEKEDNDDTEEKGSGWADAMAKVLNTGKNIESNKPLLLSKAKKDVGTIETTEEGKVLEKASVRRAKKKEWEELARKRPDIVKDRQKEKKLARIATRGVVQLFNAVREQQKTLKTQLDKAGLSTTKRDKVFKNLDKGAFLEVLSGKRPSSKKTDNDNSDGSSVTKRPKVEIKDEEDDGSQWSALKDNFMMGAKMRDWDKENSESE